MSLWPFSLKQIFLKFVSTNWFHVISHLILALIPSSSFKNTYTQKVLNISHSLTHPCSQPLQSDNGEMPWHDIHLMSNHSYHCLKQHLTISVHFAKTQTSILSFCFNFTQESLSYTFIIQRIHLIIRISAQFSAITNSNICHILNNKIIESK